MLRMHKTIVGAALSAVIAAGFVPAAASAATRPSVVHPLGFRPSTAPAAPMSAAFRQRLARVATSLPASVDLTQWAPPAGDQGQVGSCVSWAVDYTGMGWFLRHDGIAGLPLAPMYTYAQLVHGHNVGTTYPSTFAIAEQQGVDTLSDYRQGNYDYTTQPNAAERTNAANWKLSGVENFPVSQAAISAALAANKPVAIAIPVYYNFFLVNGASSDYSTTSGAFEGYHAITALGYDSFGITIENSWGTSWGRNGFARLSWSFVTGSALEAHALDGLAKTPAVSSVTPAVGSVAGGTSVTVTGSNFAPGTTVKFGTTLATNVSVNDAGTQITARSPSHAAGSVAVAVTSAGATNATATGATFKYIGAPSGISVTSRTGTTAGGTTVTISGTNLLGASASLGGVPVASTLNDAATQLKLVTPPHARGAVAISVTAIGGTTSAGLFTYIAPPAISAAVAKTTPVVANTGITISGQALNGATVSIAGRAAHVLSTDAGGGSVVVAFPAGITVSTVQIVAKTTMGTATYNWTWR